MSAREALHNEYFDGIPVDDGPNYAKGLKALARHIDQKLRPEITERLDALEKAQREADQALEAGPEAGWVGRLKEDIETELQAQEEHVNQAFADLEDLAVRLDELTSKTSAQSKARKTAHSQLRRQLDAQAEVLARLCGFYEEHDTVDEAISYMLDHPDEATNLAASLVDKAEDLHELRQKTEQREREIEGLDTRLNRTQERLDEVERKADDTDRLVGEVLDVLDEEGLLMYAPTGPEGASSSSASGKISRQATPAIPLGRLEVMDLLHQLDGSFTLLQYEGDPAENDVQALRVRIGGQEYRVTNELFVEEVGDGVLKGTDRATALQEEVRAQYFKREWQHADPDAPLATEGIKIGPDTERSDVSRSDVSEPASQESPYTPFPVSERAEEPNILTVRASGRLMVALFDDGYDPGHMGALFERVQDANRFMSALEENALFYEQDHRDGFVYLRFEAGSKRPDWLRTQALAALSPNMDVA